MKAPATASDRPGAWPNLFERRSVTNLPEIRELTEYPGYGVSADGRAWSRRKTKGHGVGGGRGGVPCLSDKWREIKVCPNLDNYLFFAARRDGKSFYPRMHRLVLAAFVGPCPPGMEGCHNDGNPANNRLENLRWGTKLENEADKLIHGTDRRGEKQRACKLTEAKVRDIRARAASGEMRKLIAKSYGVCHQTVSDIVLGRRWAWLKDTAAQKGTG